MPEIFPLEISCTLFLPFITPPARRAWRSYKFASLSFSVFIFFRCSKLGYRSWVIPLCILLSEPVSPRLFNSIPSKLCHQNTHFNMYTTTSKQQEGSTCKDSYQNCFVATNSTAKLWRGVMNRGEILRACNCVFRYFRCVSTYHLNLYISIKLMFYDYWNISTKHSF